MDLYKAIQDLYAEKEKLERVIASLEELQRAAEAASSPPAESGKRRGRKSMGSKERQEVSERMKKYWAGRKKKPADARPAATRMGDLDKENS
jgi:hypothetical protein